MNLSDARKATIRQRLRIRFHLPNGMECIVNEHGIAQVPALSTVPDFNLEEEFARAGSFTVETVASNDKQKTQSRTVNREQLATITAPHAAGQSSHAEEHDE